MRGQFTFSYWCRRRNHGYGSWALPGDRQYTVWKTRDGAARMLDKMLNSPSGDIIYQDVSIAEIGDIAARAGDFAKNPAPQIT